MKKQLFLASGSTVRQKLLDDSKIPYIHVQHAADERSLDWSGKSLDHLVSTLAEYKMDQVQLPQGMPGDEAYVVTADTLVQATAGDIVGKPRDRAEAYDMVRAVRAGAQISTGLCVEKRVWRASWELERRITQVVGGFCTFDLPDAGIDIYLDHIDACALAGALTVDGYGAQFFKSMTGSYTAILGLPLAELRSALHELGYYE